MKKEQILALAVQSGFKVDCRAIAKIETIRFEPLGVKAKWLK